jgi:hypothetical protein
LSIKPIISVGFNKAGEADFLVDSSVYDLSPERLNELAAMCFAAFHAAYSMRNARETNSGEQRNDDEKA